MAVIREHKQVGGISLDITDYALFDRSNLVTSEYALLSTKRTNPDHEAFREFERKQQEFLFTINSKHGRFKESSRHPVDFVANYRRNQIFFEYFFDGISSTEFVRIVEGKTQNGRQALETLEHLLSTDMQTIPQKVSLASIPFSSYEASASPLRCSSFSARLSINGIIADRYVLYVAEI